MDLSKYNVAWISCTEFEYNVAVSVLDKVHGEISALYHSETSILHKNSRYCLGEMTGRNIIVTSIHFWPNDIMAIQYLAEELLHFFPKTTVSMIVSTGSGIPGIGIPKDSGYSIGNEGEQHDIRLGDVVISSPVGLYGGVANVDNDIQLPNRIKVLPRHVNSMSQDARGTVLGMKLHRDQETVRVAKYLVELQQKDAHMKRTCAFPNTAKDLYFEPDYKHQGAYGAGCQRCDASQAVKRPARKTTNPEIFFGTIASRKNLDIDVETRKGIKHDTGALAVQAGAMCLMYNLAPLVVTGIADYADSHRNEHWQKYAAATAAACAKALVGNVPIYDDEVCVRAALN